MASTPTGRLRGRPRREDEKPREGAESFPSNFVELCQARFNKVKSPSRRTTVCSGGLIASATKALGDPLFSSDPVAAMKAFGLGAAKRPTKTLAAVEAAVFGEAVDSIAAYALAYARNVGISRHFAIADAVATCAERGTFVTFNGLAVSFERAMRRVYDATNSDWRENLNIGDTGRTLRVKPGNAGSLVLRPDMDMRSLAADGEFVPDNHFWRLLLEHGDVVEVP